MSWANRDGASGAKVELDATDAASGTTSVKLTNQTAGGNMNATIFTGGGSKDGIDISSWAWKDGAGGLPVRRGEGPELPAGDLAEEPGGPFGPVGRQWPAAGRKAFVEDPDLDGAERPERPSRDRLGRIRPAEDDRAVAGDRPEPFDGHRRLPLRNDERPFAAAGRGGRD